jgi:predicted ATPase
MFCALFDSRSPLTFIEEPENSVHPWIIRVFVDACRSVRDKQVILTTHSPALINYLRPEEVDVVWRRKGRTKVAPLVELDPQAAKLWESGESSIFDLVDSGWIRETIPDAFT